ncbi:hypothetical protein Salat_0199700 [Sesamum alatum]|uniref:Uncharacterized protein n=1 Tax=Sesamum alatum TaxID=300844 RepID=A0AAE1YYW8_9LAMI|nr:hypothetical protein Salat_0199700 [Sesamum alatum]
MKFGVIAKRGGIVRRVNKGITVKITARSLWRSRMRPEPNPVADKYAGEGQLSIATAKSQTPDKVLQGNYGLVMRTKNTIFELTTMEVEMACQEKRWVLEQEIGLSPKKDDEAFCLT